MMIGAQLGEPSRYAGFINRKSGSSYKPMSARRGQCFSDAKRKLLADRAMKKFKA